MIFWFLLLLTTSYVALDTVRASDDADGHVICNVYWDGRVQTFSGKVLRKVLTHGKNRIASMGVWDAPNTDNCKFAMMVYFNNHKKKITWAAVSIGVHDKKEEKYYRNFAFERWGAFRKMEERGYLKRQTKPPTYLKTFPHKMQNSDNTLNTTVSQLRRSKGWQMSGGSCPYSVVYRFKKTQPAVMFKIRWGQYFVPGTIDGICAQ